MIKQKFFKILDHEYSSESLCDLARDVYEMLDFPIDPEYKLIKNVKDPDFLSGTYKVSIVYIPGEDDEI
jgi:hypothetical protein